MPSLSATPPASTAQCWFCGHHRQWTWHLHKCNHAVNSEHAEDLSTGYRFFKPGSHCLRCVAEYEWSPSDFFDIWWDEPEVISSVRSSKHELPIADSNCASDHESNPEPNPQDEAADNVPTRRRYRTLRCGGGSITSARHFMDTDTESDSETSDEDFNDFPAHDPIRRMCGGDRAASTSSRVVLKPYSDTDSESEEEDSDDTLSVSGSSKTASYRLTRGSKVDSDTASKSVDAYFADDSDTDSQFGIDRPPVCTLRPAFFPKSSRASDVDSGTASKTDDEHPFDNIHADPDVECHCPDCCTCPPRIDDEEVRSQMYTILIGNLSPEDFHELEQLDEPLRTNLARSLLEAFDVLGEILR